MSTDAMLFGVMLGVFVLCIAMGVSAVRSRNGDAGHLRSNARVLKEYQRIARAEPEKIIERNP